MAVVVSAVLGLALMLLGLRIQASWVKTLALTGSIGALFGSCTLVALKPDSIFKFDTLLTWNSKPQPAEPNEPTEIEVSLQTFISQIVPNKPELSLPEQSLEIDCGSDPDQFTIKTFVSGKHDRFEPTSVPLTDRLKAITEAITQIASARKLKLAGLIFVGSADKQPIGKVTREQHATNSILANNRAEFVKTAFLKQVEPPSEFPRPHWLLMLNPNVPKVRLSVEGRHRFDALRAVQICPVWGQAPSQEATAEPPRR